MKRKKDERKEKEGSTEGLSFFCERCGLQMRQRAILPYGLALIQDRCGATHRYVAEIDDAMCDRCEDEFIADCNAYHEVRSFILSSFHPVLP